MRRLPPHDAVLRALSVDLGDDDAAEVGLTGIGAMDLMDMGLEWMRDINTRWVGDARQAQHVAPLAEIVKRVASISGVPCPDLDESEDPQAKVEFSGGMRND